MFADMAAKKSVAVVAHSAKKLGKGLGELREVLARAGYPRPIWHEVPKSSKASKAARRAVKKGAKLIFVWGGDGMVQRCVDALAGKKKVEWISSTRDMTRTLPDTLRRWTWRSSKR